MKLARAIQQFTLCRHDGQTPKDATPFGHPVWVVRCPQCDVRWWEDPDKPARR